MNPRGQSGNFWNRRTPLEKRIVIALAIACVVIIILLLWPCSQDDVEDCPPIDTPKTRLSEPTTAKLPAQGDVCVTPDCIRSAVEILDFIDPSVDPCHDFYKFSCGSFLQSSYFSQMASIWEQERKRYENQLKGLLLEPESESDSENLDVLKDYMEACLNVTAMDDDDEGTLLGFIEKLGGWPLLENSKWDQESFEWVDVMVEARQTGLPFEWFLDIGVYRNSTEILIHLSYPKDMDVIDESLEDEYLETMTNIVEDLNATDYADDLKQILQFHQDLAKICDESDKEEIVEIDTVAYLEKIWPELDWIDLIENLTGLDINEDTKMAIELAGYVPDLDKLLDKTPKRIQANYIMWKIVEYFSPYISKEIREKSPSANFDNRFDFCFNDTRSRFEFVLETEHIRKYTNDEIKNEVEEIADAIEDEFEEFINEVNWLDDTSRNSIIREVQDLDEDIGWFTEIYKLDDFDELLGIQNFTFNSDNIIEMITEASKDYYDNIFERVGEITTDLENFLEYQDDMKVNLIFEDDEDRLVIPTSVLQGTFFDLGRPNYLNYASLGSILGKTLANGLFSQDVWNDNMTKALSESLKCYDLDDIDLKSDFRKTYSELIYLDLVYEAYQEWIEKHEEEPKLPGLLFTPNQLFWIKSSLLACNEESMDSTEDDDENDKNNDEELLARLKYSKYFAKDFQCVENSPMNPKESC